MVPAGNVPALGLTIAAVSQLPTHKSISQQFRRHVGPARDGFRERRGLDWQGQRRKYLQVRVWTIRIHLTDFERLGKGTRVQIRPGIALFLSVAAFGSLHAQPNPATTQFQQLAASETEYRRVSRPEFATLQGDNRFNDRWNDYSSRQREASAAHAERVLSQLRGIDPRQLSEQDALSHELLRHQYALDIETRQFPEQYLVLDQMRGEHLRTTNVLQAMPRRSAADYETILVRLAALPSVLKQWEDLLREGLAKGVTPPQASIGELPAQILGQVSGPNPLATPLMVPFASIPNTIPAASANLLQQRASTLFADKIRPAYEAFHAFLNNTYLPGSRRTNGFTDLPNGAGWYALELRRHTTTNRTPRQLHDQAMRQIDTLVAEMNAVMKSVGFNGTLSEFREHVDQKLPPFATTADVLREYRDIAKRVDPLLPQFFHLLPRTPFGIEAIPAFRGTSVPYYQGPPSDGSRPGNFFVPADPKNNPRWRIMNNALHEGTPGHHLERALFAEMKDIPGFRRGMGMTAYTEGWATYAGDILGAEMGMYSDPYARFGLLASEMIAATGIAMDTGLNAFGWTRERAMELRRNLVAGDPEYAVNRVTVWPGQIMSYTVGANVIRELRDEIKASQGERFDIREFHDLVLRDGPVPLDVLEQRVRAHYARRN
jgi:uncharacterized protein (DUF885 family)